MKGNIVYQNRECMFFIDKNNCLALEMKDCKNCKFFRHKVHTTPEIEKQKVAYKAERAKQKEESKVVMRNSFESVK